MVKHLLSIIVVALLTACASSNGGPQKIYTHTEHRNMTYCIGMADTAMYVATNKLQGVPMERMTEYYRPLENPRLHLATVEKVYADNFSSAWDYTLSFFDECTQHLANVPASRANLAGYCMQNSLIADVAHAFKISGAPKERAYAYFAEFKSETPNLIIDNVYASSQTRTDIKLDVWNSCMLVISASK